MSDSLQPDGLQPTRLLHPWDFPSKSTGVGCHCLLREYPILCWNKVARVGIFVSFLILKEMLLSFSPLSGGPSSEESACQCRRCKRWSSIPGPGRSPGGGHGHPFQHSCLGNRMDRGACWLQSMGPQTVRHRLSDFHFYTTVSVALYGSPKYITYTVLPDIRTRCFFVLISNRKFPWILVGKRKKVATKV